MNLKNDSEKAEKEKSIFEERMPYCLLKMIEVCTHCQSLPTCTKRDLTDLVQKILDVIPLNSTRSKKFF